VKHSYSSDLWDEAGLKVILTRIEHGKKSVQAILGFFKEMTALGQSNSKVFKRQTKQSTNFAFSYTSTPQLNHVVSEEIGTMHGMMVKFLMMIKNLGANQNSWAEKIRLRCYKVLDSKSADIFRSASKLTSSIHKLHKDFRAEERKLRKLQNVFEEKVNELKELEKTMRYAEERKKDI